MTTETAVATAEETETTPAPESAASEEAPEPAAPPAAEEVPEAVDPSFAQMCEIGDYLEREYDYELRPGETVAATVRRLLTQAKIAKSEAVAQAQKELLKRNLIETSKWHRSIARTALLNHAVALEKAAKKDVELGADSHASEKMAEVSYIKDTMLPLYQEQAAFSFYRQVPTSGDPAPPEQTDLVAEAAGASGEPAAPAAAIDAESLHVMLLAVFGESVYGAPVPAVATLETWAPEDRRLVEEFAAALHLAASDHEDVAVPEIPDVLRRWVEAHDGAAPFDEPGDVVAQVVQVAEIVQPSSGEAVRGAIGDALEQAIETGAPATVELDGGGSVTVEPVESGADDED